MIHRDIIVRIGRYKSYILVTLFHCKGSFSTEHHMFWGPCHVGDSVVHKHIIERTEHFRHFLLFLVIVGVVLETFLDAIVK